MVSAVEDGRFVVQVWLGVHLLAESAALTGEVGAVVSWTWGGGYMGEGFPKGFGRGGT